MGWIGGSGGSGRGGGGWRVLPGAVSAVDVASEGQLTGLKVVLGLLRDAHLLPHVVRHLLLHLGCRGAWGGGRRTRSQFNFMLSPHAPAYLVSKLKAD